MQVKKFEAPTIQEALDSIKRELGPEAIILQTKKHKKGFGLMSSASVEVTAAVSDRSLQKKKYSDTRLPDDQLSNLIQGSAKSQADVYDKVERRQILGYGKAANHESFSAMSGASAVDEQVAKQAASTRDRVELNTSSQASRTVMRYAEIDAEDLEVPVPQPTRAPIGFKGMPLEDEIKHLKRMIEEMRSTQEQTSAMLSGSGARFANDANGSVLQTAFEQLVLNGVDKRFAIPLVKKASFGIEEGSEQNPDALIDELVHELHKSCEVTELLSKIEPRSRNLSAESGGQVQEFPRVIALVGPTGVGKTTTAAKIASQALLKRTLKVGLIHLGDPGLSASADQLSTYARLLNLPFRVVQNEGTLEVALQELKALDLIVVDCVGTSQKDPAAIKSLEKLVAKIPNVCCELVVSSTTRDQELYDSASRFAGLRPQGLIFTKLDEATIYGSIFNLMQKTKLPLVYFTTGTKVPEDIEDASQERLVSLIMDL